jgi:hypothetical protein
LCPGRMRISATVVVGSQHPQSKTMGSMINEPGWLN